MCLLVLFVNCHPMERPSWKGDEDGPTAILARAGPSSSHSTHWGDLSRFLPEIPPQLFLILSNSSVRSSIPPARAYIRDDYDRDHVARPAPGEDPAAYVIVHPRPSVAVSVVDSVHPSFCGMRWLHCPSPGVEILVAGIQPQTSDVWERVDGRWIVPSACCMAHYMCTLSTCRGEACIFG